MTDSSDAKIDRWRQLIAECREQAVSMSPEGRHALQTIIASYDHLIAMVQSKAGQKPIGCKSPLQ
jgi:hypothetical protein